MTKASDSASRLTAKEYASLHMKVPQSGTEWLDSMIQAARELDSEQFQAKLRESHGSYEQAAGRIERAEKETPQGPPNPPKGGRGKKVA